MIKQIVIFLISTHFLAFRLYADTTYVEADGFQENAYILDDSLINQKLRRNLPGRLLRIAATAASVPVSANNAKTLGFNFLLISNYCPIIVGTSISYFISYPYFVNMSIRGIQKRNIKDRLIQEYSKKGRIVDQSSISLKNRPAWSAYGGLTYSTFLTDNVTPFVKQSWGIKYDYPLNRFIGISHRIQYILIQADLRDKKFLMGDPEYPKKEIIDIHFEGMNYYSPIFLTLNVPLKGNHSFYGSLGTGMARIHKSKSRVTSRYSAEFEEENYEMNEVSLNYSNPMYTGIIGYSNRYGFAEIIVTRDYNHDYIYRKVSYVWFDERLQSFELVCGIYLNIKF